MVIHCGVADEQGREQQGHERGVERCPAGSSRRRRRLRRRSRAARTVRGDAREDQGGADAEVAVGQHDGSQDAGGHGAAATMPGPRRGASGQ